jgi:hypothetical protein
MWRGDLAINCGILRCFAPLCGNLLFEVLKALHVGPLINFVVSLLGKLGLRLNHSCFIGWLGPPWGNIH